jgi:hypothetical protein
LLIIIELYCKVLGEINLQVHGEGQQELEFKMSYGDKGLNDNAGRRVEEWAKIV